MYSNIIRYSYKNHTKSMNEYVFCRRIQEELNGWVNNSPYSGKPLFLHGIGGCGKSSVSQTISKGLVDSDFHISTFDFSSGKSSELLTEIEKRVYESKLFHGNEHFSSIVILDEFHNINKKQQDSFKQVLLEEICESVGYRCIVICNTSSKYDYEQVIHQPIRSRCFEVSFHMNEEEHIEVCNRFSEKYPNLDYDLIYETVPDVRKLQHYL